MTNRLTRKISILLMILISLFAIYKISDHVIHIKSRIEWKKKKKQIDENFNKQHKRFEIIDTIYVYLNNNDFEGLRIFMDSIIENDSTNYGLRVKRGFVNYKLGDYKQAQIDFQIAYDNSFTGLGNDIIAFDDALYRNSLFGLGITNFLLEQNDSNKLLVLDLYNEDLFFNRIVKLDTLNGKLVIKDVYVNDFMGYIHN